MDLHSLARQAIGRTRRADLPADCPETFRPTTSHPRGQAQAKAGLDKTISEMPRPVLHSDLGRRRYPTPLRMEDLEGTLQRPLDLLLRKEEAEWDLHRVATVRHGQVHHRVLESTKVAMGEE